MVSLGFNDVMLIGATIAGPILAVQAQKALERTNETRTRQLRIFELLMATRATRLAPEHVQALNSIELAFKGRSRAVQRVVDAYRLYFDKLSEHLGDSPEQTAVDRWAERSADLFVELLFEMSTLLGFGFDKVQLRRGVYHPRLHVQEEMLTRRLRDAAVRVLAGEQSLAMRVTEFPVSSAVSEAQHSFRASFFPPSRVTEHSKSQSANCHSCMTAGYAHASLSTQPVVVDVEFKRKSALVALPVCTNQSRIVFPCLAGIKQGNTYKRTR